jgi:hypothetical protein
MDQLWRWDRIFYYGNYSDTIGLSREIGTFRPILPELVI